MLPGAMTSGVQMAISAFNTGSAWDNAKKYIECGGMGKENGKGSEVQCLASLLVGQCMYTTSICVLSQTHKAAVCGDTIGDPMNDTYGPALNIVMKLMAIISVVFAPVVADKQFGGILFDQMLCTWGQNDAPSTD